MGEAGSVDRARGGTTCPATSKYVPGKVSSGQSGSNSVRLPVTSNAYPRTHSCGLSSGSSTARISAGSTHVGRRKLMPHPLIAPNPEPFGAATTADHSYFRVCRQQSSLTTHKRPPSSGPGTSPRVARSPPPRPRHWVPLCVSRHVVLRRVLHVRVVHSPQLE